MILAKWFGEGSLVLLHFQAPPATEVIRRRGRITRLKTDGFLFMSPIAGINVSKDSATFEYDQKFRIDPPLRRKMSGPSCLVDLHLSLCCSQLGGRTPSPRGNI